MMRSLLILLLTVALTHAASASLLLQRQAYLLAQKSLSSGERLSFGALSATLSDYPLLPYLIQQDLGTRLDEMPLQEIRDFLAAYGDSPPAETLRRAWLEQLASQQRWGDFLADYRQQQANAELQCYYRQGLLAHGQEQAALEGMQGLWLSPRSQPESCDPLFALWRERGNLNHTLIWQRIALAMGSGNSGLSNYLARLLPASEQIWVTRWQQAHSNPASILRADAFSTPHPYREAILLHGLKRLSRQDSPSAASAMDTLKARYTFDPAALGAIEADIVTFLAARNHPDASRRLAAVPANALTEAVEEWRVRLALRQQNWQTVRQWLQSMSPELAATPRWQYWRARAEAALGDTATAETFYRSAAQQRDYYGFLAAARLNQAVTMTHQPVPLDDARRQALAALPAVQRARELFILGQESQARREWANVVEHLSAEELRQAALLAHEWGWHFQAIVTLVKADDWDDLQLRFPLPHQDQVIAAANRHNIDPAWVMAVIRQESLFRPEVRSPAGARGLMQIMPGTGKLIAQELGESFPGLQVLLEPSTSIRFGSYYLRRNLERLQNNPALASAAYNAGNGRVKEWLPANPLEADIWAEIIPYRETRGYVQRVIEYTLVYQTRLGQTPTPALRLIGTIQPG